MRVLLVNTYDDLGGAAKAAFRLNGGLRQRGIDSQLLVQIKDGDSKDVIGTTDPVKRFACGVRMHLGTMPVRLYPKKPICNFSPALLPDKVAGRITACAPDLVHLHWLGASFVRPETLRRLKGPLVWTLHDSWAFTGGCHMPYDCTRYRGMCGSCPVLGSNSETDLSRWVWRKKRESWREIDLTVVTPSRWLADCAAASSLFRDRSIEVIPNGLDTSLFKPVPKEIARDLLGLPQGRRYILFGAMSSTSDPNKGFQFLLPALQKLAAGKEEQQTELLVFGSSEPAAPPLFGIATRYLGRLHEDISLALLYSAADLFVSPSIQENLPNTIMEAMACGTACLAFRQGGVPELIEHRETGYLAEPFSTDDLAEGIRWMLENEERRKELAHRARRKVEREFTLEASAARYAELYRELLNRRGGRHG